VVDIMSHTLITALAATQQGRDWAQKMQEFDLCARKLVSAHPDLFLRNLPLLAASLQGRTQLEFHLFKSRNHLSVFTIFLGLLVLVPRPLVFHPDHATSLALALTSYLEMCSVYFDRRESFFGLIDRLAAFLTSWISQGGSASAQASKFLSGNCGVLVALSTAPGTDKMESLRTLMSFSFNSRQQQADSETSRLVGFRAPEDVLHAQLLHTSDTPMSRETEYLYKDFLACDSTDQLSGLLTDLLDWSMSKPEMLAHFQDELVFNISHSNQGVRKGAYSCLMRLLRFNPTIWPAVLPKYLMALESCEEGVVSSALKHLPGMTVVCQENAAEILTTVFRLGLFGQIDVASSLSQTLSTLNMQIGN